MSIFEDLHRFAETGQGDIKKLKGDTADFRLRVGDYRVRFAEESVSSMWRESFTEKTPTVELNNHCQPTTDLKVSLPRTSCGHYGIPACSRLRRSLSMPARSCD